MKFYTTANCGTKELAKSLFTLKPSQQGGQAVLRVQTYGQASFSGQLGNGLLSGGASEQRFAINLVFLGKQAVKMFPNYNAFIFTTEKQVSSAFIKQLLFIISKRQILTNGSSFFFFLHVFIQHQSGSVKLNSKITEMERQPSLPTPDKSKLERQIFLR